MSLAGGRRDGVERIDRASVAGGRIQITVGHGRVELGHKPGQQVRVRWTVPARLPARWPNALRPQGFRLRSDATGCQLRARRARLRIDLPDGLDVTVLLRRGEITSWGAGGELTLRSPHGRVSCRELVCRTLDVQAAQANLHFAAPPERVEVSAPACVLALPGGPYAVTAPPGAQIEVQQNASAGRHIRVSAADTRILAATAPLSVRGDGPPEPATGS
ncbi:MAG TPA: hypothetical protein VHX15_03700 [Frankiaceae bacterium]|nr:hypothetical protein [Frankiaceae bacterium]